MNVPGAAAAGERAPAPERWLPGQLCATRTDRLVLTRCAYTCGKRAGSITHTPRVARGVARPGGFCLPPGACGFVNRFLKGIFIARLFCRPHRITQ